MKPPKNPFLANSRVEISSTEQSTYSFSQVVNSTFDANAADKIVRGHSIHEDNVNKGQSDNVEFILSDVTNDEAEALLEANDIALDNLTNTDVNVDHLDQLMTEDKQDFVG